VLSSPRGENLDTESCFTKSKLWELIASQRSGIYQTKNNLVALPSFLKLSVKFQRNRLSNVHDIKFFNVRPPPKFCLINLFMRSLSPAALTLLISDQKLAFLMSNLCKLHVNYIGITILINITTHNLLGCTQPPNLHKQFKTTVWHFLVSCGVSTRKTGNHPQIVIQGPLNWNESNRNFQRTTRISKRFVHFFWAKNDHTFLKLFVLFKKLFLKTNLK